jgi:excisionase family DNA binding protein
MILFNKSDAAEYLGVTVRTIDNLIASGELPPPKPLGRRVYWLREEFECFIKQALSHDDGSFE